MRCCLFRYWGQMSSLVKSLADSITSITALLVLLSLSVFIAALLGIQLFSGKFPSGSRSNFDGMVASTLTVFQVKILQSGIITSLPRFSLERTGTSSCLMGSLLWVESTVGEQSPASTLFFSSLAVCFLVVLFRFLIFSHCRSIYSSQCVSCHCR